MKPLIAVSLLRWRPDLDHVLERGTTKSVAAVGHMAPAIILTRIASRPQLDTRLKQHSPRSWAVPRNSRLSVKRKAARSEARSEKRTLDGVGVPVSVNIPQYLKII